VILRYVSFRAAALIGVGVLGVLAVSCGGGSPASSTPPTTLPPPTPPPGGGVGASSCPIGTGSNNTTCAGQSSTLVAEVDSAIDLLIQQKPELFDLNDEAGASTRQYRVLDTEAYLNGVVANLRVAGLCAERDWDNPEIIRVKSVNDFSEDFDVLLSSGYIRRSGAYRQTCTPAAFPTDPDPDAPPRGSGCGKPYPPPISFFRVKVHIKGPDYWTLDSTPQIADPEYCAAAGFVGRDSCPTRREGDPEREACDTWRVGRAKDTGRVGPTWYRNEQLCTGPDSGCENHPDNQFLLWMYSTGNYMACSENGSCGELYVER